MLIIFVRSVVLFSGILLALRVLGKRQIGEMEPTEFVVTLLISDLASVPMQSIGTPLMHGIISILVLVGMEFLITFGIFKSLKFRVLMCGKPSIVVQDGRIIERELLKSRLTLDELVEKLRAEHITDLSTIKYAILETSGNLTVVQYAGLAPVTKDDLKVPAQENGLPIILINDGRLLENNLRIRNIDQGWVESYLKKHKMPDIRHIFMMSLDESGNVYVATKEKAQ